MSEPGSVRQSVHLERLDLQREAIRASLSLEIYDQNEIDQQSSARVLATASERYFRSGANRAHSDTGIHRSITPGMRPAPHARSCYRRARSTNLTSRPTIDGGDDRGGNVVEWLQGNDQDHEEEDYFGDRIMVGDYPNLPIPASTPYRTRSSTPETGTARAVRLFAANPDPPSGSTTEDDLPLRPLPLGTFRPEPSYRYRRPIEPTSSLYPSPLRSNIIKRQTTNMSQPEARESDGASVEALPSRASRRIRSFPMIHWKFNRERRNAEEDQGEEDLVMRTTHYTSPSHWAFHFIQGFIWLPLIVYLIWRISTLEETVSFDCYDLKMNLLHLVGENITFPLANTTIADGLIYPPANATLYTLAEKHHNASSIIIPQEFQAKLRSHCVLQPVNPAVVLASYFEVLFIITLVTCGLAHMLQLLALLQLRPWVRTFGALDKRTLAIRVAVQLIAAGLASLGVLGTAWGIKGGAW